MSVPTVVCPSCGAPSTGGTTCAFCGTSIAPPPPATPLADDPERLARELAALELAESVGSGVGTAARVVPLVALAIFALVFLRIVTSGPWHGSFPWFFVLVLTVVAVASGSLRRRRRAMGAASALRRAELAERLRRLGRR